MKLTRVLPRNHYAVVHRVEFAKSTKDLMRIGVDLDYHFLPTSVQPILPVAL